MSKIELINGNSEEHIKSYPNNFFDWAIIDPPYGIKEAAGKNHSRGKKNIYRGGEVMHGLFQKNTK